MVTPRVAARLPTWLGDNIMALPSLRALARSVAEPLVLWGPPSMGNVMKYAGFDFVYVPYRRRRGAAGISDALRVINELRHRAPATVVLFPNAFEPALLARSAGIPRRVGFATDARGALLTDTPAAPAARFAVHEAERFAVLVRHLNADVDLADHRLRPTPELRQRSAAMFESDGPLLGIIAGSANTPAKRWPAARYAQFARAAHESLGARSLLLGSNADKPTLDAIAEIADGAAINAGGGDLEDLMAALLRCRAVVGNDTGAVHLAAALGVPTTVLVGPTDPRRTRPLGAPVAMVSAGVFCQPCGYHECPLTHHACMEELSVTAVLEATLPFWRESA